MSEFPCFKDRVGPFLAGEFSLEDRTELKALLCADCEFFTSGEEEDLECGCYRILVRLLLGGYLTLEQLADALRE